VLAVSDRILVMRGGRIAGELTAAQATEKSIMKFASMG
jgi:ABC-type sugar transport system ATPase subunit